MPLWHYFFTRHWHEALIALAIGVLLFTAGLWVTAFTPITFVVLTAWPFGTLIVPTEDSRWYMAVRVGIVFLAIDAALITTDYFIN